MWRTWIGKVCKVYAYPRRFVESTCTLSRGHRVHSHPPRCLTPWPLYHAKSACSLVAALECDLRVRLGVVLFVMAGVECRLPMFCAAMQGHAAVAQP
jgi:hypothetical protein